MVKDDFSALDFLSMGEFGVDLSGPARKRRFRLKKSGRRDGAVHAFGGLLPLLGRGAAKAAKDAAAKPAPRQLRGWPVSLSWPEAEVRQIPDWSDISLD
ncbi:hypothetical protein GALL_195510 [mine drainage metagenome]|uniref:Uncharacterized protein n=1 Tax=mine drainage metagenome TaxID=410659 RepID=A0A1J5RRZ9_9ZZZZ